MRTFGCGAYPMFQFTHPGRGATEAHVLLGVFLLVSIHAPREGCDRVYAYADQRESMFQFTHPGRGATDIHPYG